MNLELQLCTIYINLMILRIYIKYLYECAKCMDTKLVDDKGRKVRCEEDKWSLQLDAAAGIDLEYNVDK